MEPAGAEIVEAIRRAQQLKEQAVRRDGVGTDITPMLHLHKEGLSLGVAILEGEREETLSMIIAIVALSEADQVVLVYDAYGVLSPNWIPEYGDLARAFGNGNPDVYECLNATSVSADGTTTWLQSRYTYDGRTVVWAELSDVVTDVGIGEMDGDFPNAVRCGLQGQKERPGPPLTPPEIAAFVGCKFVVPRMRRPLRNEPCPCGSGRKAKLCCWG